MLSLSTSIPLFCIAAIVIAFVGTRLTRVADRLADKTGWGEAIVGAVILGGSTSLPGIITSVSTAYQGYAELAVSNAVGGIAAQTAFLAVADIVYRKANLEHAAASVANLLQGTLLVTLLAIPVVAYAGPDIAWLGVHPATLLLVAGYCFGIRLVSQARQEKMWMPKETERTVLDVPEELVSNVSLRSLAIQFVVLASLVAVAGYAIAESGVAIANQTGLSESLVGTLLTAVATSIPELVTTIAAVRCGALSLAVGGIIGGNCFDLLFIACSDIAYRSGSIYSAITARQIFIMGLTILMTGVLLIGLLKREKYGFAKIGFESLLILLFYIMGVFALFAMN
ncbi:MAG: sodium:calcium antiporter [Cyanobacteria bacterium P01_H01_bin.21]